MKNRNKDKEVYQIIPEGCNRESQPYKKAAETPESCGQQLRGWSMCGIRGWLTVAIPESCGQQLRGWFMAESLAWCNRGFTLIELLVVVLMIGILAAIALPQYKSAGVKARLATLLPLMNTIVQAEETYYFSNNTYTNDWSKMGVDLKICSQVREDLRTCEGMFLLDPLEGDKANIRAGYCPEYLQSANQYKTFVNCKAQGDFVYTIWFASSENPHQRTCAGRTKFGKQVCKSMGF